MWWYFILAVIFLLLGLAIHVFKWYFLISGYNLMSKQKKENVDTQGLGKLMGYYCYFNTIIFLLLGVAHALELKIVMTIAFILFSLSTIYVLLKLLDMTEIFMTKMGSYVRALLKGSHSFDYDRCDSYWGCYINDLFCATDEDFHF